MGKMVVGKPASILIEAPDSLCTYPSERRSRGRARGPYDWHPDSSGAGGLRAHDSPESERLEKQI
eukprot:4839454-Heterocapsa_arctica.AAC.1